MPYSRKAKVPIRSKGRAKLPPSGVRNASSGANRRMTRERGVETARAEQDYSPGPWYSTPESSRVSRARYDRDNQIMEVDWVDGGLSYVYTLVPPNIWSNFRRSRSKGKFVNRVLNQYPFAPKLDA